MTLGYRAEPNVNSYERIASSLAGLALITDAVRRRNLTAVVEGAIGLGLLSRGATGSCQLYQALGVSTAEKASATPIGFHCTVSLNKPIDEVFRAWCSYDMFPSFMTYVNEVEKESDVSEWSVDTGLGFSIKWDAVADVDEKEKIIAWQVVDEEALVQHEGTVYFVEAPGDRGTEIHVHGNYQVIGGAWVAKLGEFLHLGPKRLINEDLRRFKQMMETDEIATTHGELSERRVAKDYETTASSRSQIEDSAGLGVL